MWQFEDVYQIRPKSFAEIEDIAKTVQPYRGTTNKYPLGSRKYSHRHIIFKGDYADIHYGNYARSHMLRWHNDNSIEFMQGSYHQGQNQLLCALLDPAFVKADVRQGGDVITLKTDKIETHPIFKGLRLMMKDFTLHPTVSYEAEYAVVDKKASKALRGEWAERMKMIRAFFMASNAEQIFEESQQHNAKLEEDPYAYFLQTVRMVSIYNPFRTKKHGWQRGSNADMETEREQVFKESVAKFFKHLYMENNTFEWKEAGVGKAIPRGNWGVRISHTINN
jgi:hypothetical protein